MKFIASVLILFFCSCSSIAQLDTMGNPIVTIPYAQIPEYSENYNPENVAARMIDGLGYRFYWATESLRSEDIEYKPPGENTKSVSETVDHVLYLSKAIKNTCFGLPIIRSTQADSLEFTQTRKLILQNLKEASDKLKSGESKLSELYVVFKRGDQLSQFPFWNLINGHISDAIYHTGQLVSYRRSSRNPLDPMVSVFMGKNRNSK